jgi:predicted TIM-barrel enzyme
VCSSDLMSDYLPLADGFIVGSSLKAGGKLASPVDPKRVAALARAMRT